MIHEEPSSLYELAKFAKNDQSYVLKECKTLEALGLIELKKEKHGGRARLRPIALYDNVIIDCGISESKNAGNLRSLLASVDLQLMPIMWLTN